MTLYDEHILYDYTILYDGAAGIAITLTETIGLFESLLASSGLQVTLTDNITLTELLATAQTLVANITEMLTLTESMTTIANIGVAVQESLTLLEQLYTGLSINLNEDITLTDTNQIAIGTTIQEIVTLTEQLITTTDYTQLSTETLHLLDMMKKAIDDVCDRWSDRVEPTTDWTARVKPTTTWTNRTKPTTIWYDRLKPLCRFVEPITMTETIGITEDITYYTHKSILLSEDMNLSENLTAIENPLRRTLSPSSITDDATVGTIAWVGQLATFPLSTSANRMRDVEVKIIKSDGSIGTENKAATTTDRTTSAFTPQRAYYGDYTNDLWGETRTPADINNSNFGVVINIRDTIGGYTSHYLKSNNFGFNVPVGATINGIKVGIYRHSYGTKASIHFARIVDVFIEVQATI